MYKKLTQAVLLALLLISGMLLTTSCSSEDPTYDKNVNGTNSISSLDTDDSNPTLLLDLDDIEPG